jgi:predicted short-subunit dehydrogenase-like oxidoreductase (DUF2520 family)
VDVAVIGAGRVGTAVAVLLQRAGHRIAAVSGRADTPPRAARFLPGVPVVDAASAAAAGELVLVAVPDDAIGDTVRDVAPAVARGRWVAHLSGATPLDALEPAREVGARRLSIHPLQTLPDVEGAIERIPGAAIAVTADDEEGWELGERLALDLGGRPFRLADEHRVTYHAAAVFASNALVALTAVAERLLAAGGVPDPIEALRPLQAATLDNVARLGADAALTGPAVRGDAGTIDRHLAALASGQPEVVQAYVAMCRLQLQLATDAGRLSDGDRARVERVLERWT